MADEVNDCTRERAKKLANEIRESMLLPTVPAEYWSGIDDPTSYGCLLFQTLLELGLTEEQTQMATQAISSICNYCWDNLSTRCMCRRDD